MTDDIEGELQLVSHAHQTMESGSCFHFEVVATDAEFALRPKFVSGDCHFGGNGDGPRYTVQRQITDNLEVVLIVAGCLAGVRALEDDVRILVRQEHNFAQLFIDDLFLSIRKDAICLFH